jgi:hypothetical protein
MTSATQALLQTVRWSASPARVDWAGVEKAVGVRYPAEFREVADTLPPGSFQTFLFLADGLPVWTESDDDPEKTSDLGWPDWRDGDPGRLRAHLDFAVEGALASVGNGYWHPWWGDARPAEATDAVRVAHERLAADGPLVPLYVHRFLPAGRGRWGLPPISGRG